MIFPRPEECQIIDEELGAAGKNKEADSRRGHAVGSAFGEQDYRAYSWVFLCPERAQDDSRGQRLRQPYTRQPTVGARLASLKREVEKHLTML